MVPNGALDAGEVNQTYVGMCGTSMAAPAAAGLTALITEQWKTFNGAASTPLPHTIKAILVHTATDLDDVGPDYRTGYGAIDGVNAVTLVIDDDTENIIKVDTVDDSDTDTYSFDSDGLEAPRVTLVWDDPAAAQLAATTLINDLDLRIEDPDGTVFQPFLLDPNNPDTPATTYRPIGITQGTTTVDVFQIYIDSADDLFVQVRTNGTTRYLINLSSVTPGNWHHVVISVNSVFILLSPQAKANF